MYPMQSLLLTCLRVGLTLGSRARARASFFRSRAPGRTSIFRSRASGRASTLRSHASGRASTFHATLAHRASSSSFARGRVSTLSLVTLVALSLAQASARADSQGQRLSVLRAASVGVDPAQAATIDASLHAKLSKLREFGSVRSLPVPLEDLQLAAGCGADENTCLQLMAQQLEDGTLLVRQLAAGPDGALTLTLLVQDQALEQGEAWRAQGVLRTFTSEEIDRTLSPMLAELFPRSVALEPNLQVADRDHDAPDRRWRAGWSLSALGVGLLAAGLTSGLLSRRDERAFGHTDITTEQDVDRAQSAFARADRRARLATFFASTGAVVTTVGAGTLVWRWASQRRDAATANLRVQPTGAGAMITLDGAWRGGW